MTVRWLSALGQGRSDVIVIPPASGWESALVAATQMTSQYGGHVELVGGQTYSATTVAHMVNHHVRIRANGARIVRSAAMANTPVLRVRHLLGEQQAASVSGVTHVFDTDFGNISNVARVETGLSVQIGDWVKILSDDLIETSPVADNERRGEFVEVAALVGGGFVTYSPLKMTYTTNVRCCKASRYDCSILDVDVSDAADAPLSRNIQAVHIEGAVGPEVTGRFHDCMTYGLYFLSCVRPRSQIVAERIRTSAAHAAYGYGVYEASCCYGNHRISGSKMRHAYTTGARGVAAGSAQSELYGPCIGTTAWIDVTGCDAAAADTHPDAIGIRFPYVSAFGGCVGASGYYAAVQLRGRDCWVGEVVTDSPRPLTIDMISPSCGGHRIDNIRCVIPEGYTTALEAVRVNAGPVALTGWLTRTAIDIGSISINCLSATKITFIRAVRALVNIGRVSGRINSPGGTMNLVRLENGSKVTIGDLDLNLWRGSAGGTVRMCRMNSASDHLIVQQGKITRGSDAWAVCDYNNVAGKVVIGPMYCDFAPATTNLNVPVGAVYAGDLRNIDTGLAF